MTEVQMKAKAKKLAEAAPEMTDDVHDEINRFYTAYIFRRRKTGEIWTSCCGVHKTFPAREESPEERDVWDAEHEPEPKSDGWGGGIYCHAGYMSAQRPKQRERVQIPCPYCGTMAYVKELGRTGKRDNLAQFEKFVVLKWHRGALWACAYVTAKRYNCIEFQLTAKPKYSMTEVYRFKPGGAFQAEKLWGMSDKEWYSFRQLIGKPKKLPLPIQEPFSSNSCTGQKYWLLRQEEIDKSPFRYCEFREYDSEYFSAMRFLAACCIFPRQIEMLMKTGKASVVNDLVYGKRWNTRAFNWEEEDPLKSFELSKPEMKEFLSIEMDMEQLAVYKQFRRMNFKCTMNDVLRIYNLSPYKKQTQLVKLIKQYKIEPGKWVDYIRREHAGENKTKKGTPRKVEIVSKQNVAQLWLDYISTAEELGYDLTNPLMATPKNIRLKHDRAEASARPLREEKMKDEMSAKEHAIFCKNQKKYEFSDGEYILRPAYSAAEIVAEGKALHHCVGGYADRHLDGKLTIVFLRKAEAPHTPLVTIEMHGNQLYQIQGYGNNRHLNPRKTFESILEPWQEWLKKGSKRDKDGNPKLPRKQESEEPAKTKKAKQVPLPAAVPA